MRWCWQKPSWWFVSIQDPYAWFGWKQFEPSSSPVGHWAEIGGMQAFPVAFRLDVSIINSARSSKVRRLGDPSSISSYRAAAYRKSPLCSAGICNISWRRILMKFIKWCGARLCGSTPGCWARVSVLTILKLISLRGKVFPSIFRTMIVWIIDTYW